MALRGANLAIAMYGALPAAGQCKVRIGGGRTYATFHDSAPRGLSACPVCGRMVTRGLGRWWE